MVIHPISRGHLSVCKLTSFHLADKDGARINKPLHWNRVDGCWWIEAIYSPVAIARLYACNVVDILDPNSDTRKWF